MPELAPDGTSLWVEGPFGCAFQHCDDMPAPRRGPQPLHDAEAGIVVMASGRLDNRDDLLRELGAGGDAAMSDAQIVLACVRRSGIEVMPKLEGDLDVVVYDTREQKLYIARSPVDMRSFLWWSNGRRLVFAHYPKQLFSRAASPDVDEGMAGEMLAGFAPFRNTLARRPPLAAPRALLACRAPSTCGGTGRLLAHPHAFRRELRKPSTTL